MNYKLFFKNVQTIDDKVIKVVDKKKTLENLIESLNNIKTVKGGNLNTAQIAGIIQDSENKTKEIATLRNELNKTNADNRKLSNNLIKLLKRVEKLEKDDNTSASIPEF